MPLPGALQLAGDHVSESGFPHAAHVRAAADFTRCFASGRKAGGRYFRCVFRPATDTDPAPIARLGMAVSRKVDTRAVERNRLRRLIREWFRHRRAGFMPGDLIVSGKPEARGIDAARLFDDLDTMAQRLALKPIAAAGTMPGCSCPSPSGGDS